MTKTVSILGAGAFGTALAVALAQVANIRLWGRNGPKMQTMQDSRQNPKLPGIPLPANIQALGDMAQTLRGADIVLFAAPLQTTAALAGQAAAFITPEQPVICCSKGIDIATGLGGYSTLRAAFADNPVGVLSGPSFAHDIAAGLPSAITIAAADMAQASDWQTQLSTQTLRLYASDDPLGVELGGALKNVIAIACGAAKGAKLGDSARAALITRGYAELTRYGLHRGAKAETLTGLSGFGDLCLTCTTDQSRNFSFGMTLGAGQTPDPSKTVEGTHTACAMANIAMTEGLDMPITLAVAGLVKGSLSVQDAMHHLLSRPLSKEF